MITCLTQKTYFSRVVLAETAGPDEEALIEYCQQLTNNFSFFSEALLDVYFSNTAMNIKEAFSAVFQNSEIRTVSMKARLADLVTWFSREYDSGHLLHALLGGKYDMAHLEEAEENLITALLQRMLKLWAASGGNSSLEHLREALAILAVHLCEIDLLKDMSESAIPLLAALPPTTTASAQASSTHPPELALNMHNLLGMPNSSKTPTNIAQRVGTSYNNFGLLLLKDDYGDQVDSLEMQHHRNPERINQAILQLWLRGEGLQPVSWKTLTSVLSDMHLLTLVKDINETLKNYNSQHSINLATATAPWLDQAPTFPELNILKSSDPSKNVKIKESIANYLTLGELLEINGATMAGWENQYRSDKDSILSAIFRQRLQRATLTWRSLLTALEVMGEHALLQAIWNIKEAR